MPSSKTLAGQFDMNLIAARHDAVTAVTEPAGRSIVSRAINPIASKPTDQDDGVVLTRSMAQDRPSTNPVNSRAQVMAYTSGS